MIRFLFLSLIVSYFLGPRLIGGIRFDDIILLLYLLFLILNLKGTQKVSLNNPLGIYFLFIIYSIVLMVFGLVQGVSGFSPFIFVVKYISYLSVGFLSYQYILVSYDRIGKLNKLILLLILLNTVWLVIQIVLGKYITLWGGGDVNSYGIKSIGEAAAFQVGMMLCFFSIYILLISKEYKEYKRYFFLVWYIFILYALYLSQSRISLFCALLSFIVITILYIRHYYQYYIALGLSFVVVFLFYLDEMIGLLDFTSRFSVEGVYSGLFVRAHDIWGDVLKSIEDNVFLGSGVGSLELINPDMVEVHNYYLKLLLEGGLLYLMVFSIFLFFSFYILMKGILIKEIATGAFLILLSLCVTAVVQDSFSSTKVIFPFMSLIGFILALKKVEVLIDEDSNPC